jgi:DNA-binding NarL/FixJ family response regulator
MVMLALSPDLNPCVTIRSVGAPISVLVVDDLAGFRAATASVVAVCADFAVAGLGVSGEEALAFLEKRPVDVVLMDVVMPGMGGIRAAAEIGRRWPGTLVVLLSVYDEQDLPDRIAPGCQFCPKEQFGPEMLERLWRQARYSE